MSRLFQRMARQVIGPAPNSIHARKGLRQEPAVFEKPDGNINLEVGGMRTGREESPGVGDGVDRKARPGQSEASINPPVDRAGPISLHEPTVATPGNAKPPATEPVGPVAARPADLPPPPTRQLADQPPAGSRQANESVFGDTKPMPPPTDNQATMEAHDRKSNRGGNWVDSTGRIPEPLLPLAESREPAAPQRSVTGAGERLSSPATATQEPSEVHVHIGRIEVSASSGPAPENRPTRDREKPLSLKEYLSRRGQPGQ